MQCLAMCGSMLCNFCLCLSLCNAMLLRHGALSYIIYCYVWYHFVVFCVMSNVDIGHSAIKLYCDLVLLRCVIVVECYVLLC